MAPMRKNIFCNTNYEGNGLSILDNISFALANLAVAGVR